MKSRTKTARLAGSLYLALIVLGIFSLLYVPSQLYVWDDAALTVFRIRNNGLLFRLGIVSTLLAYVSFLFLPLVLYKLLHPVNKTMALIMVVLAVASVPVSVLNIGNLFSVLNLTGAETYLQLYDDGDIAAQVMFYLHSYNSGNLIAQFFWGTWLFPFGYLVYRSGFLPKVLGFFLMLGSFGYTFDFFARILTPFYSETALAQYATIPASIGEIGSCLWLLIMGARGLAPNKSNSYQDSGK